MWDAQTIALIITSVISGVAIVKWGFRKDQGIEERRKVAVQLSAGLAKLGLTRLAGLANMYSIGDYDGLLGGVKALATEVAEGNGLDLLKESFFKQLEQRLKEDGDRQAILKAVDDFKAVNPTAK